MNEIHFQIRRFTRALNMGKNLKMLKMSPDLFARRYIRNVAVLTDHFADAFVRKTVAYGFGVVTTLWLRKFTANPILLKGMGYINVLAAFSVYIWLE